MNTAPSHDRRSPSLGDDPMAQARPLTEHPEITVTWFQPDERKGGGSYVTTMGRLKKTDNVERVMVLTDGTRIPLDEILNIESEWLRELLNEF